MFTGYACVPHLHSQASNTKTHSSPFPLPIMFEPFCLLSPSAPLSLYLTFLSVWVMFPLWCPLTLTSSLNPCPPLALCLQVSRSVFSLARRVIPALVTLSFSPLTYPQLLISQSTQPMSIWLAVQPELTMALINTSVCCGIITTEVTGRLQSVRV